ncbi:MAG: lipase secretion chaperone [Tahibacter sp.]
MLDTDVDGSIRVDASGKVVADRDLRRLFDYFLERLGERGLQDLRGDLLAWLQERRDIDESARIQTMALFDRYVMSRHQASLLARSSDLISDLRRQAELRRQILGADLADAWYGEEEADTLQTLLRLAEQRGARPAQAGQGAMPNDGEVPSGPAKQMARAEATGFQLAVVQSELLAASGSSAVARHGERAALWGEPAADRLADLDRAEADWSSRLAAYARARTALLSDTTLATSLREQRLLALLHAFSEPERRRVLALGAAGLLPSG